MSAAAHIGRIGALAATLGVGAAVLSGTPVAWADRGPSDSAGSSATEAAGSADTTGSNASTPSSAPAAAPIHVRGPKVSRTQPTEPTADITEPVTAPKPSRGASDPVVDQAPAAATVPDAPSRGRAVADPDGPDALAVPALTASTVSIDPDPAPVVEAAPEPAAVAPVTLVTPAVPVTTPTVESVVSVAPAATPVVSEATVSDRISAAVSSFVTQLADTFGHTPLSPAESPAAWALLAAARRQPAAAASLTPAAVATTAVSTGPALLVLNGYDVVAKSIETVDQFTGRWAYWPGNPNQQQGRQDFSLVDPVTKAEVGSFSALITSGDPTSIGASYVQMLVTANDGINVGTDAGQTPPVGSIISSLSLFGLFGLSYSAMPTASGSNKVSTAIRTPFGEIGLPVSYDAAKGIADHTFDNQPVALGGGYTIAPGDPNAEKIIATIGLLPAFNSIQGSQTFGVFDSAGKSVGSFEGVFTTTSDVIGISTQAILVTANDGINVGTGDGQTPPVGTVYNVAYFGGSALTLLYSSKPTASGDVIKISLTTPLGVIDLPKELFNSFNASSQPPIKITAPGGQVFVPTSALIPSGVNGLPPRDVQIQGYQQFEVRDLLGNKIGTVDADVESQWDGYGVHSTSLLITNVTSGNAGSLPFEVPPVGTVINVVNFTGGFGFADIVIPQGPLTVNAFKIITPTGDIPLLPLPLPNFDRPKVNYTNPFAPVVI